MGYLRNLPMRLNEAVAAASEHLSRLSRTRQPRLGSWGDVASTWLLRAKRARLSPFDALALGGLALAAAGSAIYLLISMLAPVAGEASGKSDWRPPTAEAPRVHPIADLAGAPDSQTLTRPLFDKSRRPHAKTAQKDEAPMPGEAAPLGPPLGMSLKGIVDQGGDTRVFIVTPSTPDGAWLKIGESLEGWTFDSVANTEVTLKRAGQVAQLEFNYDEPSSGPANGAFAPPAGAVPPPPPPIAQAPQQPPPPLPRLKRARNQPQ